MRKRPWFPRKSRHRRFPGTVTGRTAATLAIIVSVSVLSGLTLVGGCGDSQPVVQTTTDDVTTPTSTAPAYVRRNIDFYKGISEPRPGAWDGMLRESDRLIQDGFNTVTVAPPVLITSRAGGQPRVILEGEAATAEGFIGDVHEKGLAVYLAPTTRVAGFSEQVEPTAANLANLQEDAARWAEKAETGQVELFAPLSRFNLVLGTTGANEWSVMVLPRIREKYTGPLAAEAVADISAAPAPGSTHDFENLDFRGYDYLLLDLFPFGESYDAAAYASYVTEVLARADEVARRDGLKGVMVGQFGAWREAAGSDAVDGPIIGDAAQADLADRLLMNAIPRTRGVFFYGWTLPGRGARDFPVEDVLKKYFTR